MCSAAGGSLRRRRQRRRASRTTRVAFFIKRTANPWANICRQRLAQWNNAGAVVGVQEAQEEGVKSAHWSDVEEDEMEVVSLSWCSAAVTTPRGPATKGVSAERGTRLMLRDVQGGMLTRRWRHKDTKCTLTSRLHTSQTTNSDSGN